MNRVEIVPATATAINHDLSNYLNTRLETDPRINIWIKLNLIVRADKGFTTLAVRTENVSRFGLCVKTAHKFNIDDEVIINSKHFSGKAFVRHSNLVDDSEYMVGLSFFFKAGKWIVPTTSYQLKDNSLSL